MAALFWVPLAFLASLAHATPGFVVSETSATALENYETGDVVGGITVADPSDFTYIIPDGDISISDPSNQFSITILGNTVLITVAGPLTPGMVVVTLTLISESDTVTVNINVLQTNFPPFFYSSFYFAYIEEDLEVGDPVITTIQAADFDQGSNGIFEYRFQDPTMVSPPFSIDPESGVISLSQTVDYDAGETEYSFIILAQETESTALLAGSAEVQIQVVPVNELAPMFGASLYSATVPEDREVGQEVGVTVMATDIEGHEIHYSIHPGYTDGEFFTINETSGIITLALSLDSDPPNSHDSFSFNVVATDIPSEGEIVQSSEVRVMVTVTDVNDNAPEITQPGRSRVTLEVQEEVPISGEELFVLVANDIDGDSDGDTITYKLSASDNSLMFFTIDSVTGVFQQSAVLDREACTPSPCHYEMSAMACDGAPSPMCSSITVAVSVLDFNDHPPVITNSPLTKDEPVLECEVDGRLLSLVTAEDTFDTGDFAEIVFEATMEDHSHILLNQRTGQLSLGYEPLDYETGDRSFSLSVKARDNPDGPMSDQLTSADEFVQSITVSDCNDNPPVFSATQYTYTITENMNDLVGMAAISTTDADATPENRAVTYRVAEQGPVDWFDISEDGDVYIRSGAVIDREDPNILRDGQGNGVLSFTIEAENTAPTGTLTSLQNAQVVVTISDQNDNAPVMQNPPLSGTDSIVLILEDAPVGTILAVVRAYDADVGDNAVIQYDITSGNDLGKFSINSVHGIMTLADTIDFEVDPQVFQVVVTATNPPPALSPPDSDEDDIQLTIMIQGANEHAPHFQQNRYDRQISEYNVLASAQQHEAGDIIATVFATDADANDDIQYSITGGNEDDVFEIPNPQFGNIALKNPQLVDYETTTSYALIITATDLVVPTSDRKTNTTYLNIVVIDENDNIPQFSNETYTGLINEEEPDGTGVILIIPITASDADSLGGSETLEYEINSVGDPLPSPFLAFTLSEDGTSLTTTVPIDREEFGDEFSFQIIVRDTAANTDTAMVMIDILDINDNPPIIQETPEELFITIPENNLVGSTLRTITAVDADLGANADFIFTLQGGAGYFSIGHTSGVVTQEYSLQALEPPLLFQLTVTAIDSGSLSSNVTWSVNLTYTNDHPPIFDSSTYSGSITECVANGFDIVTIRATDEDSDSQISYYIESSATGDLFVLDDRGQEADILTNGADEYDREMMDVLTFTVFATDGVMGSEDDSAIVTITVLDCNDNYPIFTQDVYEVDVAEGTVSGTTVIQVHTNDADIGENEEVRFNIETVDPPSLTDVFVVDTVTGGILAGVDITNEYTGSSTCSSLTEQSNNITITVRATDQATEQPRLSNYTTVFIRLLDRNSEAPSFVPTSFYSFSVSENTQGVEVGVVEAMDECDQNSVVTYSIIDGEDSAPFEIDPSTGVIRLVSELDREANDLLVVQLEAVDDGTSPGPQTGYASVSVNVLDENDNTPVLAVEQFEVVQPESIPADTVLVTLLASDPDLMENGTLSFSILQGDTSIFELEGIPGSDTSHLVLRATLDRETLSSHLVVILVEDGGISLSRNTTAMVNLTVTDVNDNNPIWTAGHGTHFDIFENTTDTLVVDLDATDIDEGINQELVYFFVGDSQDMGPFHIDRSSGSLYLVGQLDYETTQEYTLQVVVSDRNGEMLDDGQTPLTNSTTVLITVMDINDNLPYFNRCPHRFKILETLEEGSLVGDEIRGSVVDRDSPEILTPFYYYLVDEEDVECNEAFCIDVNTGAIKLESEIDFETKEMYTFYVVVSDRPNLTPQEAYSSPTIDLCDTVATQRNNITKVEVVLVDVNDQQPEFVPESLLAAVAEEAEFDTTVTVLQALDTDENSTYSTVYYEIIAVDPPYLVDRQTGEVTTADTFTGRSGEVDRLTVVAYDNEGGDPSFTATAVLTVRVFKECQQIIAVADQPQEQAEGCRTQLETAIANETGHIIYVTKIRVHQDEEQNIVDTTKADMVFYALDHTTGEVVEPQEVIGVIQQALDLQDEPISNLREECFTNNFKPFCSSSGSSAATGAAVSTVVSAVIGLLGALILGLLICLLCVCALERRKARKLKMRKKRGFEQSSNFSQFSQMATSNPIWMPPYEQWEEESTTTAAHSTALDRENPLYESQELTIEMFQDDKDDMLSVASSHGDHPRVKPPQMSSTPGAHDSVYSDYDPLADALGISGQPEDSQTSLI